MKVSDYITEYIIEQGITDVFGYPGGMVTHLMDSFGQYSHSLTAHISYHEQAAAFAACGYAQASGKPGVAYATSGPGATNMITGICNAFFDSIPVIFITGQVNTFESKGTLGVRQRGFQETDILSMVAGVTKYAVYVEMADKIKYYLDKAFYESTNGRKGPVLLDIPMNILRAEVDPANLKGYLPQVDDYEVELARFEQTILRALNHSTRPCILLGNGIKSVRMQHDVRKLIEKLRIPVVTSMIAVDVPTGSPHYYGFIGAYGDRVANFIVAKSDLIISIGSRLDVRQVGAKRENFAPNATIIRVDIDEGEFDLKVHSDEEQFILPIKSAFTIISNIQIDNNYQSWYIICNEIRSKLEGLDISQPNEYIAYLSKKVPGDTVITADVGQNQVWVAQSFQLKESQEMLFSGGHGAMGYSLPAAIGAYYGNGRRPVVSFNGDGGLQMNIQELQYIFKEQLPIKIIVLNNVSLGMIRHFQKMYFDGRYVHTNDNGGYTVPDFCKIANAYGIKSFKISEINQLDQIDFNDNKPVLINIMLEHFTYVFPKLEFGKPNQDQEPLLNRELYDYLMSL